jgi:GNAT superfamily N-acetyltransferase
VKQPDSFDVNPFRLTLTDINEVNVESLHALSIGVRWPHRAQDWEMLRELGRGVAAVDEIGRIVGSAMSFECGSDFATFGMVITVPRLQVHGTARWLMDHLLEMVGNRRVGLNATRAAKRLYRPMGFKPECGLFQCQGRVVALPDVAYSTDVSERCAGDIADILELDRKAFGADRSRVLSKLAVLSKVYALSSEGVLKAYAFCRPFGRGYVVGPVVASNDQEAIAVVAPHLRAHEGDFVRLDTRDVQGELGRFLHLAGMPVFDTVTTMSYRGDWITETESCADHLRVYGVAAQALG